MESILNRMHHPDVLMYRLCKEHSCLPFSGGLGNQPASLIGKWIIIYDSLEARKDLDRGSVE